MNIRNFGELLHSIHVMLYPNYLPGVKGKYIARTANETVLSIEQICASIKFRGGFTGQYDDLVKHVKQFFDEAAHHLCDGYSINTGYFSIHPEIFGTFNSVTDIHENKKPQINFKLQVKKPLYELSRKINVKVTGMADSRAFIDKYIDTEEKTENSIFIPGNLFCISGNKIKITGNSPDCGVFFVPVEDPAKAVKVARIAENSSSKVIGIAPDTGFRYNRIEIRTRFSGQGSCSLKAPLVITGDFILEAV